MKKTKLLTSVAALALVLSLGACNQPEDDSTSSEETSSETSSSSSSTSTEQEKVTLTNYTISITLKDEAGEPIVIPFYDSVYICGSWDSWAEWTVLTDIGDETESVLTTTFASIEEGTYNFKGVVGGQEETPSWSLTELIVSSTGGDVSFEVNTEDGDNYTNNLEFTVDATKVPVLEETPMDDETIAGLILAQVSEIYEDPWEAIHGYSKEDDEMSVEVWYTSDEEGGTYGKAIWYDDEDGNETRYIVGETQYIIDGEGEYDTANYSNEYEDEFDTYAVATDTLGSAVASDATIAHEEGSSIYTLTVVDDDTTDVAVAQRAGDVFTVLSVLESEEDEEYFAEVITAAEVEAIVDAVDFGPWIYGTDKDPVAAMFDAISEGQNYTLTIEYYDRMTDYYSTSEEAAAAWNAGQRYSQDLYVQITYTEDAILMEYYTSYIEYLFGYLADVELYVNTEVYVDEDGDVVDEQGEGAELTDVTAVYWLAEDEETGDVALTLSGYYEGHWQDVFWSALDLVSGGFPTAFNMGQTTLGSYGPETDYSFSQILMSDSNMYYFIECLFSAGNWFADYYTDGPYIFETIAGDYYYYGGYYAGAATYYADYDEFDVELQTATIDWTVTYPDGTEVHWYENNYMCASIWNVGTSAIPEEYASYLQA